MAEVVVVGVVRERAGLRRGGGKDEENAQMEEDCL